MGSRVITRVVARNRHRVRWSPEQIANPEWYGCQVVTAESDSRVRARGILRHQDYRGSESSILHGHASFQKIYRSLATGGSFVEQLSDKRTERLRRYCDEKINDIGLRIRSFRVSVWIFRVWRKWLRKRTDRTSSTIEIFFPCFFAILIVIGFHSIQAVLPRLAIESIFRTPGEILKNTIYPGLENNRQHNAVLRAAEETYFFVPRRLDCASVRLCVHP